jgi:hypothetical protein
LGIEVDSLHTKRVDEKGAGGISYRSDDLSTSHFGALNSPP